VEATDNVRVESGRRVQRDSRGVATRFRSADLASQKHQLDPREIKCHVAPGVATRLADTNANEVSRNVGRGAVLAGDGRSHWGSSAEWMRRDPIGRPESERKAPSRRRGGAEGLKCQRSGWQGHSSLELRGGTYELADQPATSAKVSARPAKHGPRRSPRTDCPRRASRRGAQPPEPRTTRPCQLALADRHGGSAQSPCSSLE